MATEPVHGSSTGVAWHGKRHESYCLPCANYAADRGRAYTIASGKRKSVSISVDALARLLRGAPVDDVLAGEFGPLTFEALGGTKAASQHG